MKKQYYLNVKNAHHVRFISIILGEDIDKVFKLVDRTVNVNGKVVKLYGNDYLFRKKKREAIKKLLNKLAPDMRKHLNAMAKIMQELSTRQSKKNKKQVLCKLLE